MGGRAVAVVVSTQGLRLCRFGRRPVIRLLGSGQQRGSALPQSCAQPDAQGDDKAGGGGAGTWGVLRRMRDAKYHTSDSVDPSSDTCHHGLMHEESRRTQAFF